MVIRARSNELEATFPVSGDKGRPHYLRSSPSGVQIVDGRYVDAMIADVGHFSYEFAGRDCSTAMFQDSVYGSRKFKLTAV